jgi:hypothetical protein
MKAGYVLLGLGVVIAGVGVYLHVNKRKEEKKLSASGVLQGGGGYYVKCADGATSVVYDTYDQAVAMVDKHCQYRGGGAVMQSYGRRKKRPRTKF